MRTLMLLRHAEAMPADGKIRDRDRPLSPRGQEEARKLGVYLARHRLLPQRALVSPAKRTRETWELLTPALGSAITPNFDDRLYEASAQGILDVIQATATECMTLLVIGHNPGIHRAAVTLVAAGDLDARARLQEGLPTSGLVTIEVPLDDWHKLHTQAGRLTHFLTPELLKAATE
jgi:phosphohistidine phosphatase